MPIQVACPECGKKYKFSDERAGRTIECKECGADIKIASGRRGAKAKNKGSGLGIGLLIGGGVAGLAVVGGLAFVLLGQGPPPPAVPVPVPSVNNVPLAAVPPGASTPAMPGAAVPNAPAQPNVAVPPNAAAQPNAAVPAVPPKVNVPAASGFQAAAKAEAPFKPVNNWTVQVDPAAEDVAAEFSQKFNVKTVAGFLNDEHVLYPETSSLFALIGSNNTDKESREVWNLATATKIGQVKGPRITGRTVGFSPDAQYVAWFRFEGNGGGVEVYDIKAKKTLGTLAVDAKKFNVAAIAMPTPKRLVALSDVNRGVITWQLPSGDLDRQIELGEKARPGDQRAFSPGGRFLAVLGDYLDKSIHIYDLDAGTRAGSIDFEKRGTAGLLGMAFSHDGKELAAAFGDGHGRESERVVIWNAADGSIVADFPLPDPDQRKNSLGSRHTSLQWFPNGRRMLLNGMHVIDRDAKKVVFAFPKPTFDTDTQRARRVLSDTTVAAWEGTKQSAVIAPLELKADDIARAQEVAAAGGLMFDARLPKLTPLNREKAADRTAMDAAWKAAADPAPSAANLTDAIPLKSADGRLGEIEFSRADAGIVCLRLTDAEVAAPSGIAASVPRAHMIMEPNRTRVRVRIPPVPCRQNWLELYDAAKRQPAGRIDIDFPCELMAVSPDGSRVLVQAIGGEGRLDVFAADGQHVAGCRPFQNEADKEKREIASASMLDANTVAVCSLDDRLIVFRVPTCEPIYAVDDAGLLAVSPGGKLIATCSGNKIELRDALTGEGRGRVTLDAEVQALSFSPQGDRLGALTTGRKGSAANVIALASGEPTSIAVPQAMAPLVWCGDNELLLGRPHTPDMIMATPKGVNFDRGLMLIDLTRKAVLWSYRCSTNDMTFGQKTFDGRVWTAGPTGKGTTRQIAAVALPEPAAKKQLSDKKLEAQAVVRPGLAVSVQFNVADPPGIAGYSEKARTLMDNAVIDNGLTVKEGEPIRMVVSISPGSATGTMTLQSFGFGRGGGKPPDISVQRRAASLRVAYEIGGKAVWESKHDITNDFIGITRLPEGKDAQTVLDENMWQRALSMLERNLPPSHVFSAESAKGLGTSRLTGGGPVPAPR